MIVRELVTLLKYKEDSGPLNHYMTSLREVKRLALEIFDIYSAVETVKKVMEIADEWNTVAARVKLISESAEEQKHILDALQRQVDATGQSYEGIGNLFVQIAQARGHLHYTTDETLRLTGAVSELLTISGGSAASQQRAIVQFDQMLALGKVTMENLRVLVQDSPRFVQYIANLFGGRQHFDQLVHSGQLSAKAMTDALIKNSEEIHRRALLMPMTFSRAFAVIRNDWGHLIYDIGEGTTVWESFSRAAVIASHAV